MVHCWTIQAASAAFVFAPALRCWPFFFLARSSMTTFAILSALPEEQSSLVATPRSAAAADARRPRLLAGRDLHDRPGGAGAVGHRQGGRCHHGHGLIEHFGVARIVFTGRCGRPVGDGVNRGRCGGGAGLPAARHGRLAAVPALGAAGLRTHPPGLRCGTCPLLLLEAANAMPVTSARANLVLLGLAEISMGVPCTARTTAWWPAATALSPAAQEARAPAHRPARGWPQCAGRGNGRRRRRPGVP